MCKRNVQTGCTGYVHIAAMRMMENNGCFLQFIKLSPVDVMRLSLGAWWPEGRSSSSVSQFLPSCSWSTCQMAVWWNDGYRGDLSPWLFLQLCFCSVWGRCPAERGGQTLRCAQLSARLSAELCSPDLWRYCTTLRCTESIHIVYIYIYIYMCVCLTIWPYIQVYTNILYNKTANQYKDLKINFM